MKKYLFIIVFISLPSIIFTIGTNNNPETFWDKIMKEESNFNISKGIIYMQQEDYSKASIEFSKAIDKNPSSMAYSLFGASLYWMGDVEGSIKEYDKAIELDSKNAIAWQLRGISMARIGNTQEALENFKKAISIDPTRADVNMNIGSIYFSKGYMLNAIEYLKKAIKIDPQNPLFYYQIGLVYFYLERYDEAEESFEKAISFYRDYEEAMVWLGITKEKKGEIKEAIKLYKKAIEIKPYDFFARYKIALAIFNSKTNEKIEKYIDKNFLLTPKNKFGGISLSISYSSNKENKDNENIQNQENNFSDKNISQIYKNLLRAYPDEEINFSIDIISVEKMNFETVKETNLGKALSGNFNYPHKKYSSLNFFLPAQDERTRKENIYKILKKIESDLSQNSDKNYRINFTMNTKKVEKEDKTEDSKVVYYPRNIGNDMGLWIIGNNWISIVEDDLDNINKMNESPQKYLLSGLANLLIGESENAILDFDKIKNSYPVFSKLGLAVSYICRGKEEKAINLFEEVLKEDKKNKIAAENLKWLKQK